MEENYTLRRFWLCVIVCVMQQFKLADLEEHHAVSQR